LLIIKIGLTALFSHLAKFTIFTSILFIKDISGYVYLYHKLGMYT